MDKDKQPTDPFVGMAEAAVSLHELFVSLMAGGFTEDQAIKIVVGTIVAGQGKSDD